MFCRKSGVQPRFFFISWDYPIDRIVQKIGEETAEVIIAVKNRRKKDIVEEVADLWFHTLIMLSSLEIKPEDIFDEFERRKKE